jgi:nucleotide-binding universal stress UspA family protein
VTPTTASIRTIAVPLDGSELARAALPLAATLAREMDSEVVLIRASAPEEEPSDLPTRLDQSLDDMRASGLRAREILVAGPAADAIVAATQDVQADLVAMTTHGRTGLPRMPIGTVADAVIRQSPVPVILVRPMPPVERGIPSAGAPAAVRTDEALASPVRLLVALDGSPEAEAALAPAVTLARGLQAPLSLIRVMHGHAPSGGVPGIDAASYLERIALRLQDAGIPPDFIRVIIRSGSVPETLLDQAAREHTSVLIMAIHGEGGPLRSRLGSCAQAVIAQMQLPVMVISAR